MLFGCLPVQNIPVFLVLYGTVAFCLWYMWRGDNKIQRNNRDLWHVRRCETRRRSERLAELHEKRRGERMRAYLKR